MSTDNKNNENEQDRSVQDVNALNMAEEADPFAGMRPPRMVRGFYPAAAMYQPASVTKKANLPPAQRFAPMSLTYTGGGLVDLNGYVVRGPYAMNDIDQEAQNAISAIRGGGGETDASARLSFFTELKRLGFYEGNDISDSVKSGAAFAGPDELRAVRFLLTQADMAGFTWDRYLFNNRNAPSVVSSSGPTIRVTPKEDIVRALVDQYMTRLGRIPTIDEKNMAIANIQSAERAAVRRGEQMPSLTSTARSQADMNADEVGAYSAGLAMNRILQLLARG